MASSTQRSAAHQATGAPPPPPPEEVTAFFTLVERVVAAGVLGRHARCAELADRAATHAERLWGDNSLVVADLRLLEAGSLRELAFSSTSSSEEVALMQRAWALLVPLHALLLRRLDANTLLPGTNKEEEVTYFARSQACGLRAKDLPVPPEAVLHVQRAHRRSRARRRTCLSLLKRSCKAWASCLDTKR